jgi:hypothetical protein
MSAIKAGLLTHPAFAAFPFVLFEKTNSGLLCKRYFLGLTATGIVHDFHMIPFSEVALQPL